MSSNLDKAYQFLGRIFNGADARLPTFAAELEGMLDQAEEEGKVRYMAEQEVASTELLDEERAAERAPQAADEEIEENPVVVGETPPVVARRQHVPLAEMRRRTGRVVASGKPHPKKKR